jgi:hypothetical protein
MDKNASKADVVSLAPMNCEEVGELMYLFICDELEPDEAAQIGLHIGRCSECRTALADTVQISGALSAVMPRMPLHYFSANN